MVEQAHATHVQRRASTAEATEAQEVHVAAAQGVATSSSPLPYTDTIQRAFGRHDISGVQAHTGPEAAASARAMGAHAYATGNHVVLGGSADLHTVAHEAAHVIQQRGGVQLKGGVGDAGDEYERNADVVADAVVQGKSSEALLDQIAGSGASPAIQRKAITAGELAGTTADGTGDIFDSRITMGNKFKVSTEVESADWSSVIGAYHTAIRPLGNVVSAAGFTDKKLKFHNNLPKKPKWGQVKRTFVETVTEELKMPSTISLDSKPEYEYWETLATNAKTPNNLRNNNDVGLIDPFVVEVEVQDRSGRSDAPWRVLSQFADSGSGYITKIYDGATDLGGGIATSGNFNARKDEAPGDKSSDYLYSSTHEQGSESFNDRIGGISRGKDTRGGNATGLDAVTWLAAEGARFAPIADLGGVGTPESRFFIKPNLDNWTGYKFLTTSDLMRMWLTDFGKQYNISAGQVREKVEGKGKTTETNPPNGWHYNLTTGSRHEQK